MMQNRESPAGLHRAALWLLPLAFMDGVLAAVRWPETYTLSHMVIDYHFGFGKRGLIGEIVRLIDRPPYHYVTLAWMAFAVFALWMLSLMAAAWPGLRRDAGVAAAFVIFFLSAGFISLVCDIGRGEHFGLMLAVPCLMMPLRRAWLPVRAAALLAAVLMQEVNFPIVAPLLWFDVWIGWRQRQGLRPIGYAAATILPATLLTWYLGNLRTACDTAAATAYFQQLVADFQIQAVPVATLCIDGRANIALVFHALWSDAAKAVIFPLALAVALPSTLFNLVLTARVLAHRSLGVAFAGMAIFAPLALLIVGADVVRFVTLIQVTSLLVLVSAVRRLGLPPAGTLPPTRHRVAMIMALAAFELGSAVTLNDGNEMRKFPFEALVLQAFETEPGHAASGVNR